MNGVYMSKTDFLADEGTRTYIDSLRNGVDELTPDEMAEWIKKEMIDYNGADADTLSTEEIGWILEALYD